jgi:hypothetical protein
MITDASFRVDLPEFSHQGDFTPAMVAYALAFAVAFLNVDVWGPSPAAPATNPPVAPIDFATELYAAHLLALDRQAVAAAAARGVPGLASGPISSKSVGPASRSYDTNAAADLDAGHWNMTTYGQRFIRLARLFGARPTQVGVGAAPALTGPGYPGPFPFPVPEAPF